MKSIKLDDIFEIEGIVLFFLFMDDIIELFVVEGDVF